MTMGEVIPFPIRATKTWRFILSELPRRKDKAEYAEKVIKANIDHLQRLGVAPERIAAEIAHLERLFYGAERDTDQRASA